MDWESHYSTSQALTLQISPRGTFLARSSISRRPYEMGLEGLLVLLGFTPASSPRAALKRLLADWPIRESAFAAVVDRMIAENLLVFADSGASDSALSEQGFGSVKVHHRMLRDTLRVLSYRDAIQRQCQGKRVVEIGCGTGILSMFAAQAGARRLTAIEGTEIGKLAREMFEANGCDEVIDLRLENSLDVELEEPAEVIIHELLGVDPFDENMLATLQDAQERLLAPKGRFLPSRIEVCGLGFEVDDKPFFDHSQATAEALELAKLYNLNFEPYIAAFERAALNRPIKTGDPGFEPKILTAEASFYDIDLQDPASLPPQPLPDLGLRVTRDGVLGGIVVYFRAHLDESTMLSNSPYSAPTCWQRDARALPKLLRVEAGQWVPLRCDLATVGGIQRMSVDLL